MMKKVVQRDRNKGYYRVLHLPIWLWVFFILPGHLTHALYLEGPDRRHWIWLAIVFVACVWRGAAGRLPGVEPAPYVKYFGADQPNVPYRVVCYTAAWIDLLVPFVLNLLGLGLAVAMGKWFLSELYFYLYYPFAVAIVLATLFDLTPRARRSTKNEGEEKGWFYVAIWTVVPTQVAAWGAWRLGSRLDMTSYELDWLRLAVFLLVGAILLYLSLRGKLPRTQRYHLPE
jgi:hypothetical protein